VSLRPPTRDQSLSNPLVWSIRAFIAAYDAHDPSDRQIAVRIREVLHKEIYRRERDRYAEWVDLGGEA